MCEAAAMGLLPRQLFAQARERNLCGTPLWEFLRTCSSTATEALPLTNQSGTNAVLSVTTT